MSIVSKKIMMGSGAAGDPVDDEFNRTSFLSHFEGANNGVNNAFDDGSASNHTITANGNVTQGSFGPFARPDGEWAVDLVPNTGFLRAVGAGDISGDFTVETWVFMNKDNGNYIHLTYNAGGIINVFNVYNGSVQNFLFGTSSTAGQTTLEFNDTTWDAGVWTHLAAVRSSGTLKIYVNGVADATTSTAVSGNLTDLEYIGTGRGFTSDARIFDGKVSNVRFSSTARYTSNFTPPTAPFTTDSDTNLLTCQSNRFVDNSSNGHTITPSGTAAVSAFGPFLTSSVYSAGTNGASGYFDGYSSGDYLQAANSADWDLGAGNFTWECFAFIHVIARASTLYDAQWFFSVFTSGSGDNGWGLRLEKNGTLNAYLSGDGGESPTTIGVAAASSGLSANAWHHIAVVKNGTGSNNIQIYVDGVSKVTGTFGALHDTSLPLLIGRQGAGSYTQYFGGYISNLRIVKGTAVYTSNFTPPTAPLTAITNTKLLLNMADGQAVDSAAQNNLTLVGNTKTSTGQAKFGNTSMVFDGTGDGAYYANGAALGTGDWTIETFLWVNDFDASLGVFQYGGADGALGSLILTNQKIRVLSSAVAARLDTSGTINAQTWYHVAYVSYNGTVKVYINGTADSTTFDASSTTWTFTDTNIYVGARYYSSAVQAPFDGYFDEFRVSHFARYTANFSPPTEPFPDKGQ